jgi:hypothetical protein
MDPIQGMDLLNTLGKWSMRKNTKGLTLGFVFVSDSYHNQPSQFFTKNVITQWRLTGVTMIIVGFFSIFIAQSIVLSTPVHSYLRQQLNSRVAMYKKIKKAKFCHKQFEKGQMLNPNLLK